MQRFAESLGSPCRSSDPRVRRRLGRSAGPAHRGRRRRAGERAASHPDPRDDPRPRVEYAEYGRQRAEAIVDTGAHLVCASVGLNVAGESVPYVAGWGEDGAREAVTQFAKTIDELARRVEDALAGEAGAESSRRDRWSCAARGVSGRGRSRVRPAAWRSHPAVTGSRRGGPRGAGAGTPRPVRDERRPCCLSCLIARSARRDARRRTVAGFASSTTAPHRRARPRQRVFHKVPTIRLVRPARRRSGVPPAT